MEDNLGLLVMLKNRQTCNMSQNQVIRIYDSNTKATYVSISTIVIALMFGIALMSAGGDHDFCACQCACNVLIKPSTKECDTGTIF